MKNIKDIQEKINHIFTEDMQNNRSLAGVSILFSTKSDTLGVAISGTHEEIYTTIAQFLFNQPEFIDVFQLAVNAAKEFNSNEVIDSFPIVGEA